MVTSGYQWTVLLGVLSGIANITVSLSNVEQTILFLRPQLKVSQRKPLASKSHAHCLQNIYLINVR